MTNNEFAKQLNLTDTQKECLEKIFSEYSDKSKIYALYADKLTPEQLATVKACEAYSTWLKVMRKASFDEANTEVFNEFYNEFLNSNNEYKDQCDNCEHCNTAWGACNLQDFDHCVNVCKTWAEVYKNCPIKIQRK